VTVQIKSTADLRTERLREPTLRSLITVAALWPKKGANLGTILRTVDAVGSQLVIPKTTVATKALRRGNTIGYHPTLFRYILDPIGWLHACSERKVAVELAHGSISLTELQPATEPTILILGHEITGVPDQVLATCDEIVEIPMSGVGNSLNVAVAASLVLYKLEGLT
jgi:tRNA (guanosine-2'-O-)-methyltransferase